LNLVRFNADDCLSYLLYCTETKEALIIDPTFPEEKFIETLESKGLTLKFIIDTHTHADHASAGAVLAGKSNAPYLMHRKAGDHLDIPPHIPQTIKKIIASNQSLKKDGFLEG
jgi:glyoxylase-like metal-dependent hydrolase (beta-lactamase superfamily II)